LPPYNSPDYGSKLDLQPKQNIITSLKLTLLNETSGSIAEETVKPLEERDESYHLSVPLKGEATLEANTSLGLLRGLATFEQLWYNCPDGVSVLLNLLDAGPKAFTHLCPRTGQPLLGICLFRKRLRQYS
jgi:hypothetical protein